MPTYIRPDMPWPAWDQLLRENLAGIPHLTLDDMLVLMGADLTIVDDSDRWQARWDLRAMGYRLQPVSLWGRRRVFLRYLREEVWSEDHDQINAANAEQLASSRP